MDKTLVYQLYPRTWQGGIKEIQETMLNRIAKLGADYIWLSPIYPSPGFDHGYDIEDYMDIDPRFGTMTDFDNFVAAAHDAGIGVLMDLVLNHTSTMHPWFLSKPQYYCWSETDRDGWINLFDKEYSAWAFDEAREQYYLHMFHPKQADLNWFPDAESGEINADLVKEFQRIVDFWTEEHYVDGFRLDFPQAMNKDLRRERVGILDLITGDKGAKVIDAVFSGKRDTFLIMECYDPSMGGLNELYASVGVDFVMNVLIKTMAAPVYDNKTKGYENTQKKKHERIAKLAEAIAEESESEHFMLELESHDSPRFSAGGLLASQGIRLMFESKAKGICLYQGQELGIGNPSPDELPNEKMLELDAEMAMRVGRGVNPDSLRRNSRANARVPIPMYLYEDEEKDYESFLAFTKKCIAKWHDR